MYMDTVANLFDNMTISELNLMEQVLREKKMKKCQEAYEPIQVHLFDELQEQGNNGFGLRIENEWGDHVILSPKTLKEGDFVVLVYHEMDEKRKEYICAGGD